MLGQTFFNGASDIKVYWKKFARKSKLFRDPYGLYLTGRSFLSSSAFPNYKDSKLLS